MAWSEEKLAHATFEAPAQAEPQEYLHVYEELRDLLKQLRSEAAVDIHLHAIGNVSENV